MFPLIPALILLLLQGQPALERGRAPASLEGLPWAIVAQHLEADQKGRSKAKLVEVCALLRLLAPDGSTIAPDAPTKERAARIEAAPVPRLSAGYASDQRSRDGPQVHKHAI